MANRIEVRPASNTRVVRAGGAVLGGSRSALELLESNYAPVVHSPHMDSAGAVSAHSLAGSSTAWTGVSDPSLKGGPEGTRPRRPVPTGAGEEAAEEGTRRRGAPASVRHTAPGQGRRRDRARGSRDRSGVAEDRPCAGGRRRRGPVPGRDQAQGRANPDALGATGGSSAAPALGRPAPPEGEVPEPAFREKAPALAAVAGGRHAFVDGTVREARARHADSMRDGTLRHPGAREPGHRGSGAPAGNPGGTRGQGTSAREAGTQARLLRRHGRPAPGRPCSPEGAGRGGSGRASNLAPACGRCGQAKGAEPVESLLAGQPDRPRRVPADARTPLHDAAAASATRRVLFEGPRRTGLPVSGSSGGRTESGRARPGIPKSHALDAACVGETPALTGRDRPVPGIRAMGRGPHARTRVNRFGFPVGCPGSRKSVRGFRTGASCAPPCPRE